MMHPKYLSAGVCALALASYGMAAAAQDNGFFVDGYLGHTNYDVAGTQENDTSYGASLGYDINQYFAVAVGYDDFGSVSEAGTTLDADGYNIRLIGTLPLNDTWALFGQIGNQHWDATVSSGGISGSVDNDDVLYGVGGELKLGRAFSLLGGVNYFKADDVDISTWYLGGEYRFH